MYTIVQHTLVCRRHLKELTLPAPNAIQEVARKEHMIPNAGKEV